jgi:hypothetical protein
VPIPELNPVVGDHTYVLAPLAVKVVDVLAQIIAPGMDTTGLGLTLTVTERLPVAPPLRSVAKTVYVVVPIAGHTD